MLNAPAAGAEFTLPERGELSVGRAPELDITLDHRSVSREHAKIACDRAEVRITDAAASTAWSSTARRSAKRSLQPGDIIELGDVIVRFVGAGEHYVFDPADARAYRHARHPRQSRAGRRRRSSAPRWCWAS